VTRVTWKRIRTLEEAWDSEFCPRTANSALSHSSMKPDAREATSSPLPGQTSIKEEIFGRDIRYPHSSSTKKDVVSHCAQENNSTKFARRTVRKIGMLRRKTSVPYRSCAPKSIKKQPLGIQASQLAQLQLLHRLLQPNVTRSAPGLQHPIVECQNNIIKSHTAMLDARSPSLHAKVQQGFAIAMAMGT